jgi:hypothetical protein
MPSVDGITVRFQPWVIDDNRKIFFLFHVALCIGDCDEYKGTNLLSFSALFASFFAARP